MLEELKRKLESITGEDPISNARRMAIIAMINRLTEEQET